jgi:hypothetical protein
MYDDTRPRPLARWIGLCVPGGGQLVVGDLFAAALVFVGTTFFAFAAALELVVHNRAGYPAPLELVSALAALEPPLTIVPDFPVAVIFGLTLHIGAAFAAGSARFGGPARRVGADDATEPAHHARGS